MTVRLLLLLSMVAGIAGCGGSSDEPANRTGQAQAAQLGAPSSPQPVNQSTASSASSQNLDDPQEPSVPDKPVEEPAADDEDDSLRKWTDAAGKPLVAAEFIDLMDGNVCLQTKDGRGVRFPLQELSQADQEYVRSLVPEADPDPVEEEVQEKEPAASDPELVVENADALPQQPPEQYGTSRREKVVIPFDFISKFDEGRYGSMVGDVIWKKLDREGGFEIPESMLDVRDFCEAKHLSITPDTPLDRVSQVVRGDFDGDIAIWGSVERAPGAEWEIYDLVIKCADFSAGPEPKLLYEVSARTKSVSEIPHLYVQQMLDKLYDRKPGGPPPVDPLAEESWKTNPNLVEGGDFQRGAAGVPVGWAPGWEAGYVGQYERLGNHIQWVPDPVDPSNRVIRFTFEKALGDSTGVAYYNAKPFPIEKGAKYRFQCRWRTNGAAVKVFIKCYDEMGTEYAEASKRTPSQVGSRLRSDSPIPESTQLRECYRSQQNLYGEKNTWNLHTQDFTPKQTRYTPRWGKVMLYAYLGAGVVEFDDVVLKQILPASPSETKEEPRHSMESTVTIRQMEENERRGREAAERLRQRGAGRP